MKKLKLNLDDIKVESFETMNPKKEKKGTVAGYDIEVTDDYPSECCTLVTWCNCPKTYAIPWTVCQ